MNEASQSEKTLLPVFFSLDELFLYHTILGRKKPFGMIGQNVALKQSTS